MTSHWMTRIIKQKNLWNESSIPQVASKSQLILENSTIVLGYSARIQCLYVVLNLKLKIQTSKETG